MIIECCAFRQNDYGNRIQIIPFDCLNDPIGLTGATVEIIWTKPSGARQTDNINITIFNAPQDVIDELGLPANTQMIEWKTPMGWSDEVGRYKAQCKIVTPTGLNSTSQLFYLPVEEAI